MIRRKTQSMFRLTHNDSPLFSMLNRFFHFSYYFSINSLFRRLVGNMSWLIIDKVVRLSVGLFIGVWVARYLGPAQYGLLNFAQAICGICGAIAGLGIDSLIVRDFSQQPQQSGEIMASAFLLRSVASLFALFVCLGLGLLLRDDTFGRIIVGITSLGLLFQTFDIIDFWFQSQLRSRVSVIARNIAFGACALVKIILVLTKASLPLFAAVGVAEVAISALTLCFAMRYAAKIKVTWQVTRQRIFSMVYEGAPLTLSAIVVILYMRIDQVMLNKMLGDQAVGNFSAAIKISEILFFIPSAVIASAAPVLATLHNSDHSRYLWRFQHLFLFLAWYALLAGIIISLSASWIVHFLYGAQYSQAASVLTIHVWATLSVAFGVASGQYLLLEGLTKISLQRTALGCCVNIALNLIMIPRYGVCGAAFATVISYSVATFWLLQNTATKRCLYMMGRALLLIPGRTEQ